MSQVEFDAEVAARIESLYRIGDAVRRRRIVRETLGAAPGERILDVGCGPGFYCAELAEEVGPSGSVVGVDSSPAMLELAARRCAGQEAVELRPGEAVSLPVDDASVDAAVCVQVLEYVADPTVALAEMHRALRPGGRVVVWDVDLATVSLHTADSVLTEPVQRAWDQQLTNPVVATNTCAADALRPASNRFKHTPHPFTRCELNSRTPHRGRNAPLHRHLRAPTTTKSPTTKLRSGSAINSSSVQGVSCTSQASSSASRPPNPDRQSALRRT